MDPPPSTSSNSSLCRMLGTVITVQVAHRQLLLDVLNELHALWADLVDARGSTRQAPPFDESWFPFGNLSQKGGDCRLYLRVFYMYSVYFGFDVFLFIWVVYVTGETLCLSVFMFLISHIVHWLLIYIMRLFMVFVFYFMFCEIKKFNLSYLYFPHMCLCVCWVF